MFLRNVNPINLFIGSHVIFKQFFFLYVIKSTNLMNFSFELKQLQFLDEIQICHEPQKNKTITQDYWSQPDFYILF